MTYLAAVELLFQNGKLWKPWDLALIGRIDLTLIWQSSASCPQLGAAGPILSELMNTTGAAKHGALFDAALSPKSAPVGGPPAWRAKKITMDSGTWSLSQRLTLKLTP